MSRWIMAGLFALFAQASLADVPRVVTDIRPVQALVARIMAGLAAPSVLIRPGHEPHDYRLRATEMSRLAKADIVFWVGDELTPALAHRIARRGADLVSVELLKTHHTRLLRYRSAEMFDDPTHATHLLLPGPMGHEHDGHDSAPMTAIDPNAWLDPDNAKLWADEIALQMAKIDPKNAETYVANAWHAKKEIDEAVADARDILSSFQGTPFVVYHDGYHYFEAFFDVQATAAVYHSYSQAPARIDEVRELLVTGTIPCAFVDPRFGDRTMREITQGTRASLFFLDPLGVYLPSGPKFYTNLLRGLAEDFSACGAALN